MLRYTLLILVTLIVAPLSARADGPVGEWLFDMTAFQAQFDAMMAEQLASMPAETRAQMKPMLEQALKDRMGDGERTVVFNEDGSVIMQHAEGRRQSGTWIMQGDVLQVTPDDAPAETLSGKIEGDTIRLRPENRGTPDGGGVVLRRITDG